MGYNNSFGELHETATKIYIKAPASVQRNKSIYKMLPFQVSFIYLQSCTSTTYTTHSQSQQPAVSSFPVCVVRLYPVHLSAFSVVVQRYLLPVVTVVTVVTRSHRISSRVFVYHQDQGLCYMLHYHPFSVPLLGVKRHACVCCYYYTTFFTLDFVGSDANNCG